MLAGVLAVVVKRRNGHALKLFCDAMGGALWGGAVSSQSTARKASESDESKDGSSTNKGSRRKGRIGFNYGDV